MVRNSIILGKFLAYFWKSYTIAVFDNPVICQLIKDERLLGRMADL